MRGSEDYTGIGLQVDDSLKELIITTHNNKMTSTFRYLII